MQALDRLDAEEMIRRPASVLIGDWKGFDTVEETTRSVSQLALADGDSAEPQADSTETATTESQTVAIETGQTNTSESQTVTTETGQTIPGESGEVDLAEFGQEEAPRRHSGRHRARSHAQRGGSLDPEALIHERRRLGGEDVHAPVADAEAPPRRKKRMHQSFSRPDMSQELVAAEPDGEKPKTRHRSRSSRHGATSSPLQEEASPEPEPGHRRGRRRSHRTPHTPLDDTGGPTADP
jgi:hypothetical protein